MKITIESTTKIVKANGIDCRIWEGATAAGVKVQCLIPRIAVLPGEDTSEFERELKEQRAPSTEAQAFPLRMIL
ncbi:MAG: hypothetical protein ABSF14_19735 [Terriglobia bacterium]|jgi:hypothetical protein